MASTPRGCPSGRCNVHVKNLERGKGGTWRTGILESKTVVTAQCMFGVVGNSANWDPGKNFCHGSVYVWGRVSNRVFRF